MSSCTKEADDEISAPVEKAKIFMSIQPRNNGLKSGSIASSTKTDEIADGDTVTVQDITDLYVVLVAENEYGFKSNGTWIINMIDNELSDEAIDLYLLEQPNAAADGSSIGIQLSMLGLYRATFKQKFGEERVFFIRHLGMPGDPNLGDGYQNGYAFRLERNLFQWYGTNSSESKLKKGYSLFLRYNVGEFGDQSQSDVDPGNEKYFHAFMYAQNHDYIFKSPFNSGETTVKGKIFKVKRCKYSPEYISFTFLAEDIVPFNGIYETEFYSGEYEKWRWAFRSLQNSNWTRRGVIAFLPF
ncbi:MAG: hypothetical protein WCT50_00300 [Patescibacteria group bacterium]